MNLTIIDNRNFKKVLDIFLRINYNLIGRKGFYMEEKKIILTPADVDKARSFFGKCVRYKDKRDNNIYSGILIGYWNFNFRDQNSQTKPYSEKVSHPYNILLDRKNRRVILPVDEVTILN